MARTKNDPRSVEGFKVATNLSLALSTARDKYTLSCEPPPGFCDFSKSTDTEHVWDGRKFDSLFGLPKLCEFATDMWEAHDRLIKLVAGFDKDFAALASGTVKALDVERMQHVFRIPRVCDESPLLISTVVRTYYPIGHQYTVSSESTRHRLEYSGRVLGLRHADYRVLTQAQQAEVETLRTWGKESLANKAQALDAVNFLDVVLNCADQMRDVFDTLPGLDGILGALVGVQNVRDAMVPKARSRPFAMQSFRANYPSWPTLWPKHRATLLAMAIAASQDWRVSPNTVVLYHRGFPTYPVDE